MDVIKNKKCLTSHLSLGKKGLSFLEVMVTVAVLSFGIVMIFKAFFLSLNYLNHMTYRLHATILMDNKLTILQQQAYENGLESLPTKEESQEVKINNKIIKYIYSLDVKNVENLSTVFEADLKIAWLEDNKKKQMSRSAYLLLRESPDDTNE